MTIILLTLAASLAALIGGFVALHTRKHLDLAISLTAGLVLGLVAFDLLPEVFDGISRSGITPVWPMLLFVGGFLAFHTVEKFILMHHDAESQYGPHTHPKLGLARAVALSAHSFLDGLSIGVGFQVSTAVGTAVAFAVIGHRFADGFDTANFMLLHNNKISYIKKFLAIVIVMPVLGGVLSLFVSFSEATISVYLGLFAGILMYIAASNILPQAHAKSNSLKYIGYTLLGIAIMFIITRFIG